MIFHDFLLSPTMIVFLKDVGRVPSRFWSWVLWWISLRNVEFLHPTRSNPLVTIYHIPMLHCTHFLWSYWDRVKWFNAGHWNHEALQWICDVGFLAHKDVTLRTCSHNRYISDIMPFPRPSKRKFYWIICKCMQSKHHFNLYCLEFVWVSYNE